MKVALINNNANMLFTLCRYLRDRKIDAELLLMNEPSHFRPDADSFTDDYKSFCRQLDWGGIISSLYFTSIRKIRNDVKNYDFIIGCGYVPAILYRAGISLDIFVPYGGDLYSAPFFNRRFHWHLPLRSLLSFSFQAKGIRNSKLICIDSTNHEFESAIDKLAVRERRLQLGTPMIYVPQYNDPPMFQFRAKSKLYPVFAEIRKNHDLVIFHHTRHLWKNAPDLVSTKNNDRLFIGFSEFLRTRKDVKSCIITFEYGFDVRESKKLVADLGIERYVFWFPLAERKEIMMGLKLADICAGEFNLSWLTYCVANEALALGIPLMHYRDDKLYLQDYPELYPMINARTSEDITAALCNYSDSPDYFRKMGEAGRNWLQRYVIDHSVNEYVRIISSSGNF